MPNKVKQEGLLSEVTGRVAGKANLNCDGSKGWGRCIIICIICIICRVKENPSWIGWCVPILNQQMRVCSYVNLSIPLRKFFFNITHSRSDIE